jgi:hypothetical protein
MCGMVWFAFVRWSPWPGVIAVGVSGAVITSVVMGLVPLVRIVSVCVLVLCLEWLAPYLQVVMLLPLPVARS